jgi:type I restriction enzyme R subunit
MEHRISAEDDAKIRVASGGLGLKDLAHQLVQSLDPDLSTVRPEPVEGQANQAR